MKYKICFYLSPSPLLESKAAYSPVWPDRHGTHHKSFLSMCLKRWGAAAQLGRAHAEVRLLTRRAVSAGMLPQVLPRFLEYTQ